MNCWWDMIVEIRDEETKKEYLISWRFLDWTKGKIISEVYFIDRKKVNFRNGHFSILSQEGIHLLN